MKATLPWSTCMAYAPQRTRDMVLASSRVLLLQPPPSSPDQEVLGRKALLLESFTIPAYKSVHFAAALLTSGLLHELFRPFPVAAVEPAPEGDPQHAAATRVRHAACVLHSQWCAAATGQCGC